MLRGALGNEHRRDPICCSDVRLRRDRLACGGGVMERRRPGATRREVPRGLVVVFSEDCGGLLMSWCDHGAGVCSQVTQTLRSLSPPDTGVASGFDDLRGSPSV